MKYKKNEDQYLLLLWKKLSILIFFIQFSCAFSQQYNFKQWAIKDGLPQSDVYITKQDMRGYIWIGTGAGVSVFNGLEFKNYTIKNGLAGNIVRCIFEDSSGKLWFGTNNGISIYDGNSFYNLNKKSGLKGTTVLTLFEDCEKNMWAGTDDGGVNKISKSIRNNYKIEHYTIENGLSANTIFDIFQDSKKAIWLATFGGGINQLTKQNNTYSVKVLKGLSNIPSDNLISFSADKIGNIWFATYDAGIFKFNLENEKVTQIFDENSGLNSNSVWDIFCSIDGNIWAGTVDKGINRVSYSALDNSFNIQSYKTSQGLSGNQILSLMQDNEKNIWIGTNGDGLSMMPGDELMHYTVEDGLPGNTIQSICEDKKGNIWVTSLDGGCAQMRFSNNKVVFKIFTKKEGLPDCLLSCVAVGKSNNKNIWLGTVNNGILKYDGIKFSNFTDEQGLVNNRIYCLYVDSKGIVWCGTSDGISRFDGVKFLNISTKKMLMDNEGVKQIIEDKKGNIWFATAGGLARYSGDGLLRTFDEVEGLKDKDVNAISLATNGDIFIGTNSGGLYKFNHKKNDKNAIDFIANDALLSANSIRSMEFANDSTLIVGTFKGFDKIIFDRNYKIKNVFNYNATDGFTGTECNDNALCKDHNGNIWFGTVKGLTRFSPGLEKIILEKPKVYITSLQLFFKDVDWKKKEETILPWFHIPQTLQLSYSENNLTFKVSAISFTNSEKVRFTYILEGRDLQWSPPQEISEINFSGLDFGSYIFKIKAENSKGVWSDIVAYKFKINPPWYKTIWFYLLCALVLVSSVYLYIRKLQSDKIKLEQIVRERTHELAEKNQEIIDSITYAKEIQHAMLPPISDILNVWSNLFIFFQPKDIVSGDFYWFKKINENEFLIACADCTGHGVPGGFMSMICSEKLTLAATQTSEPSEILYLTNNAVKETLRQEISNVNRTKDGMELCLLKINTQTKQVSYSGAKRLLWIVENGKTEITEIKPTKESIASDTDFDTNYQQINLQLKVGDILYATSDGYADQFGGEKGKKFMTKQLKDLIVETSLLPISEQKSIFEKTINEWKKGYEQVDDLLLMGISL